MKSSLIRSAGAMGLGTFFSRILGLVREQVFAYFFGAGRANDAFQIAFRIPNLLRDLFAEGAMSAALVPCFVEAEREGGAQRAWRLAGLVFRVLVLVVGGIAILGIIFAPELVSVYAPPFRSDPEQLALTSFLTRILFPFFPLIALAAAVMAVLNAKGYFFIPAFSSAVFNFVSVVVGVLGIFGAKALGFEPIVGMAVGVVSGGLAQVLCQLPLLYRSGYQWHRRKNTEVAWHREKLLQKMLWLMLPGTIGLAATQINVLVNTILATSLGTGAVSWLNYAFRLMQFPIGIFGVSLAVASQPTLALAWGERRYADTAQALASAIKAAMAISLPAAAGLFFLAGPIIELIYQYGSFHASDTQAAALALSMYSLGLFFYSSVKILVPACYAIGNSTIPVLASVAAVLVTIILNVLWVHRLGFWALALGTSIGAAVNCGILWFWIANRFRAEGSSLGTRHLMIYGLKALVASMAMGAACAMIASQVVYPWLTDIEGLPAVAVRLSGVGILVLLGLIIYTFLCWILGISEVSMILTAFFKSVKKRLGSPEKMG